MEAFERTRWACFTADFLIDPDGLVQVAYYGSNLGDHLSLDAIYEVVGGG